MPDRTRPIRKEICLNEQELNLIQHMFDVVNNRLLSGKPMIITTIIPLNVMQKAADLDDRRIFDRILEVCVPVVFGGDSFRKTNAADNMQKAARYLNGASH